MQKTLVIVSHPNIDQSIVNKRWIEELKKHPDLYTVHDLYQVYPDGKISVEYEQALIEQHAHLILQFPIYWFNCPPLLKTWLDDVFSYGWAYGETGDKLKQRKFGLAVTAGGNQTSDYAKNGRYQTSLTEVLLPFSLTAQYVQADYQPYFAYYGAEHNLTTENLEQSAQAYIEHLATLFEQQASVA